MKVKAYPKDLLEAERTPDKRVVGWYCQDSRGKHYILRDSFFVSFDDCYTELIEGDQFGEIDLCTAAVKTGKKDKNGKDIYGSVPEKEFRGGDRLDVDGRTGAAEWFSEAAGWRFKADCEGDSLGFYLLANYIVAIIPKEADK